MNMYETDTSIAKSIIDGKINIKEVDEESKKALKLRWDRAAKPLDSLGKFEDITAACGGILGRSDITLKKRAIVSFCADNGIVEENISQSGQEVTLAVAKVMGTRESSVCKMAKVSGTEVIPVDIGINNPEIVEGVLYRRVANGTKNFAKEEAMSEKECLLALQIGIDIARDLLDKGYEICGIGEMGIGNTTTTAAVAAALLKRPASDLAGKGAGLSNEGVTHKAEVITKAIEKYNLYSADAFTVLRSVGGLDIAGMTGVILGGAIYGLPVVLDGVISCICALVAQKLLMGAGTRVIPSHLSRESAAGIILYELGLTPIICADMALGEGTGAAMFFSLLDHAMALINNPLAFDELDMEAYTRFE